MAAKTYVLQKDFGTAKPGLRVNLIDGDWQMEVGGGQCILFPMGFVENNPEWFLPKEDISEFIKLTDKIFGREYKSERADLNHALCTSISENILSDAIEKLSNLGYVYYEGRWINKEQFIAKFK